MDDRQVADFVDDEQRGAGEPSDALAQASLALGLGQAVEDVGERREVDAAPGAHGLDPKRDGEVAFAGAGLADEVDHLVAVDEVERLERIHPPLERLERVLLRAGILGYLFQLFRSQVDQLCQPVCAQGMMQHMGGERGGLRQV